MILPSTTTPSKFRLSDSSKPVHDFIETINSIKEVGKYVSTLYMDELIPEPHMYTNTINGNLLSSQGNAHVTKDNELTENISVLQQVCGHFNHNNDEEECNN